MAGERLSAEEYADYHRPQLASFKAADADLATVLTLVGADEAIGVVAAARDVGSPSRWRSRSRPTAASPDGTPLRRAIEEVDAAGGPDWFVVNCAHPTHVAPGLDGDGPGTGSPVSGPTRRSMSHAELDEAEELDEGDPAELRASSIAIVARLPVAAGARRLLRHRRTPCRGPLGRVDARRGPSRRPGATLAPL